ncbi:hypothetical protein ACPCIU_01530 [Streptomyces seoulensis]
MNYPAYHVRAARHIARSHTSPVRYVLLVTIPAIVAVAALRPR